ncbi:S41 family peptidase [Pontibacter burrus]|uniref:Tail specific protease domain-containing protein n=1 Tax=Pontibacter burrus TaxID=2704466 RepID=A0A6B3LPP4_9BACT|nr:S41 family peptidase [Pontibacter burrus]NEM97025.1 hypothetical protein [Pontibacter burrus]
MKQSVFLTLLLFCAFYTSAATTPSLTENQKLESLAKVWGFLKYYHPEVAKGKLDWDTELMQKIAEVKATKNQQELNQLYLNWLDKLGPVKACKSCKNDIPESYTRNLTLDWIYDSTTLSLELSERLHYIRENRNQGKNAYVRYPYKIFKTQAEFTEQKYEHLEALPSEEYRLLGLFRHWNIINYFFPYKYATDVPWDGVLTIMLPKFREAANPLEYHLAMLELSNSINDGHNFFTTDYTRQYFGSFFAPFKYKIIDGIVVVSGFYNEGFAKADSMNIGDVITKINGRPVSEVLEEKLPYISGSNYNYKASRASYYLLNGDEPTVIITIEKNGKEHDRQIRRYAFSRFGPQSETIAGPNWKMLTPGIGYLQMGKLERKEVKPAMKDLKNTKALIVDMREYPKPTLSALSKQLLADVNASAVMPYPDLKYPGVFRTSIQHYGKRNNKNHYKGKVIILINEGTMSAGEFGTMIFQLAPNATVIGSQTAGADGNVTYIYFPGGFRASMSGLGVYYPDGRETQRIGIVPDIEVKPTIAGIRDGKDEILERAIEFIELGK